MGEVASGAVLGVALVVAVLLLTGLGGGSPPGTTGLPTGRASPVDPGMPATGALRAVVGASTLPRSSLPFATTWTNLSALSSGPAPSARSYAAMTYDGATGELLLFGGLAANGFPLGDTWTYANGTWTNLTRSLGIAPSPRSGAGMAYLPSQSEVVLFGGTGFTGQYFGDTWVFRAGSWTNLSAALTSAPPALYLPTFTEDSSDGVDLLSGGLSGLGPFGYTWTFTGTAWTNLSGTLTSAPSPRLLAAASNDPADHGVLLYGGYNNVEAVYDDTWLFQAGTWTNLTSGLSTDPGPMLNEGLTWLGSEGAVVLTSGAFVDAAGIPVESPFTWAWSSGSWTNLTAAAPGGPAPRFEPSVASVPLDNGSAVLFGGANATQSFSDLELLSPAFSATAALSTTHPAVGGSVNFSAHVSGGLPPYALQWGFGSAGSSTAALGSVIFPAQGVVTVTFRATDAAGRALFQNFTVDVGDALGVTLATSTLETEVGGSVDLSASAFGGTPPYTYTWTVGAGGPTSGGASETETFGTAGSTLVTVEVTDATGTQASDTLTEIVLPSLEVRLVSPTPGAGVPPGTEVTYNASLSGGAPPYALNWSFGDGQYSSGRAPTHGYGKVGVYQVLLRVEDALGFSSSVGVSLTVSVSGMALAVSASGHPLDATTGESVYLFSNASGGSPPYAFAWSLGAGSTLPTQNATTSFATAGDYSVSLIVTDSAGSSATAWVNVTVTTASTGSKGTPGGSSGSSSVLGGSDLDEVGLAVVLILAAALLAGYAYRKRRTSRPPPSDALGASPPVEEPTSKPSRAGS